VIRPEVIKVFILLRGGLTGCRFSLNPEICFTGSRKWANVIKKEGVKMEEHIFVTPEGLNFKPSNDSPNPDYVDFHSVIFSPDATVNDTIKELMELNTNIIQNSTMQNLPFSINIEPQRRIRWTKGAKHPILAS